MRLTAMRKMLAPILMPGDTRSTRPSPARRTTTAGVFECCAAHSFGDDQVVLGGSATWLERQVGAMVTAGHNARLGLIRAAAPSARRRRRRGRGTGAPSRWVGVRLRAVPAPADRVRPGRRRAAPEPRRPRDRRCAPTCCSCAASTTTRSNGTPPRSWCAPCCWSHAPEAAVGSATRPYSGRR